MRWTLVTGNEEKFREIKELSTIPLDRIAIDLPEPQGLDCEEIASLKLETALRELQRPLIVEDTGLHLEGYGGFPGPLVKWILRASGSAGLIAMADGASTRRAEAVCTLAAGDGTSTIIATGTIGGVITKAPRGSRPFGWDDVFQPDGSDLTFAEMALEEKNLLSHRSRAWKDMFHKLKNLSMV